MPMKKKDSGSPSISSRTRSKNRLDEIELEEEIPPSPKPPKKKRQTKPKKEETKETEGDEKTKLQPGSKAETTAITGGVGDQKKTEYVEKGNVFFLYRPKLDHEQCSGMEDVQRMVMILQAKETFPNEKMKGISTFPLITKTLIIPKKTLPHQTQREQRMAIIDMTTTIPEPLQKLLDESIKHVPSRDEDRHQPASHEVAEGEYAIIRHFHETSRPHTHLIYRITKPHEPHAIQREFGLEKEGDFVITIKNPSVQDQYQSKTIEVPKEIADVWQDRRWNAVQFPEMLGFKGLEVLLSSTTKQRSTESKEIKEELEKLEGDEEHSDPLDHDMLHELHWQSKEPQDEPILTGSWK